jgi:type VI secretion system protein
MSIEISLVKSPDNVQNAKVCQIFTERGGTIGRSQDNTWVVEDPERFISSVHSQIVFDGGQYYLADISTNGTFLNGSAEPIGNGNRVPLKNGDRFMLGEYEFLVSLQSGGASGFADQSDPFSSAQFVVNSEQGSADLGGFGDALSDFNDPFANHVVDTYANIAPLFSSGHEETDPLAMLDKVDQHKQDNPFLNSLIKNNQPDNADPMQHAVSWPSMIPDDWDKDVTASHNMDDFNVGRQSSPEPISKSTYDKDILEKLQDSELKREALEVENEKLLAEVIQLKQKLKNLQNSRAETNVVRPIGRVDETLVEAMGLDGRKLTQAKKGEISATVGVLMRESIAGLMQALSFRKKIKEEFRINVTTIQPVENNPLKFSANIEDALENMFIKENKAYMKPIDAVREGFQGISEHQVAVLAGIQAAFRGMIERLDPEALEKRFEKYRKTGVIKVGQKGKNWESYKEFHQDLVNNIDNSFQYLFGYDFVQAYEEQLQRLVMLRKSKANKSN